MPNIIDQLRLQRLRGLVLTPDEGAEVIEWVKGRIQTTHDCREEQAFWEWKTLTSKESMILVEATVCSCGQHWFRRTEPDPNE